MSYTINYASGVRQDHRGRKYRLASYPNGKVIEVPYQESGTKDWGDTIPLPPEPQARRPVKSSSGPQRERIAVLECRWHGDERISRLEQYSTSSIQEMVNLMLRPLMRSPDNGKTWVILQPGDADWFVQFHEEKESP